MKSLSSKFIIISLMVLMGSTAAPISFAQDVETENEGAIKTQVDVAQQADPYESYEQIKALGVVDPAIIPNPVEPIPESNTVPSDEASAIATKPYSDGEAIADIEADIIETSQNEPVDQSAGGADELDLRIVTLDEDDVETLDLATEEISKAEMELGADAQNTDAPAALPSLDVSANVVDAPRLARADILPFFLSAQEYLAARGGEAAAQTSLIYEVTTQPVDDANISEESMAAPKTETVQLLIGTDYVAHQSDQNGSEFRIYDFKYNRLLRILPPVNEGEPASMINVSLFALAHRNTRRVATMTRQGRDDVVKAGAKTLDAFWIESAMSWAMNDRLADMETSRSENGVDITYKEELVFTVGFDEAAYPSPAQSDALLVFAHHNWPVHPSALREFFAAPAPVKSMTIVSKSPNIPQGSTQNWILTSRTDGEATFPLPDDVINQAMRSGAIDPIAFVINAAARGVAMKGRPTRLSAAADFTAALADEDRTTAWLAGQRYAAIFGPCKDLSEDEVCDALAKIEADKDLPSSLKVLITAFKDAQTPAMRAKALSGLKVYANDPDAAPIILRLMGVTRAKLGRATARATGLEGLDAENLMKTALARDPYDPQTYLGLAQYNAARGDYEAAWDIYDTLRSSIDGRRSTRFGVDKVEAALIERAPGYFELPVMVTP